MDGKKRHHQAMGGGMDMGLLLLAVWLRLLVKLGLNLDSKDFRIGLIVFRIFFISLLGTVLCNLKGSPYGALYSSLNEYYRPFAPLGQ
jgi:hypothetical protein